MVTHLADPIPEKGIEGSAGENDLGEACGGADSAVELDATPANDAVQRLRPPLVGGDTESRHAGRRVDELGHLLVEREARDEVPSSVEDGQREFAEWVGLGGWVG